MQKDLIIKPADIYNRVAEMNQLLPGNILTKEINSLAFDDNPPRYYRLKQIESICRFYGIESIVKIYTYPKDATDEEFIFIQDKMLHAFEPFYDNSDGFIMSKETLDVFGAYKLLFKYRMKMEDLLDQKVYLESKIYEPIHTFINGNNREFHQLRDKINLLLGYCVDIHQKEVSIKTLIKDFDYPDVNLEEIDGEWV